MTSILVLLNEEYFKKGMFFLHVELVAAKQASNVRKTREKAGFKKLQIIVGECPQLVLRSGEKVYFSVEGALVLAKHQNSSDMFIVFDDKAKHCFRQIYLEVNKSNADSVAFVKFARGQKKEFMYQAMIEIGDHLAKNKPTRLNDLSAAGTSTTTEHSLNIPGGPDSLNDNKAQPISSKASSKDLNDSMKRLNISSTEGNSFSESENTAPGSYKDDTSKREEPNPDRSKLSAYDKILSDHGLAVLSQALDPQSSWFLLVSLGLSNGAITKHETNNPRNITRARADALIEWRNNKKDKSNESLYYILMENLDSTGRKDMVHHLKTVCKKDRYPDIADFQ